MNYFVHIGFDGSNYSGWQRQPNVTTVQENIESKLEAIFKQTISIYGCGRTDAGVHASQFVFNFKVDQAIDFDFIFRLNKHLPNSIVAYEFWEMPEEYNARYGARWRTYDYFLHSHLDPVLYKYSTLCEVNKLVVPAMQEAAKLLTTIKDFKGLCKQPELHNHTLCNVIFSELYVDEANERLQLKITSNRFLRGMIRLTISYLLQIGRGELTVDEFESRLRNQELFPENRPAAPNGLFLSKIEYPFLEMKPQKDITSFLKIGLEIK